MAQIVTAKAFVQKGATRLVIKVDKQTTRLYTQLDLKLGRVFSCIRNEWSLETRKQLIKLLCYITFCVVELHKVHGSSYKRQRKIIFKL